MGLFSSIVWSCDTLWQGIGLEDNSSISSIQSQIYYARFGIYNVEGSNKNLVLVKNTQFVKNVIGIYNPANAGKMEIGPDFTGNKFIGGVLPTASNSENPEWPALDQISHAGMVIHNSHFTIGKSNPHQTELNRFTNMMCGIAVYNNHVSVKGSIFSNIFNPSSIALRPFFSNIGVRTGVAVHSGATNGFGLLDFEGLGKNGTSAITSSGTGVNVIGGACYVYNCRMTDVSTGVILSSLKTNMVGSNPYGSEISNNYILCNGRGIFILECENNLINVETNDIIHQAFAPDGIACINNTNGRIQLIDNVIYTSNNGIYLNRSPNSILTDNIVSLEKFGNCNGFLTTRSEGSILNCNGVNYLHQINYPVTRVGYSTSFSNDLRMECNSVINCGRGFYFPGVSMNADYLTNWKINCGIGLHLNQFAVIGPQENKGNIYSFDFDIGARHDGASQVLIDMSQFIVESNTTQDYPYGTNHDIFLPNAPPNSEWYYTDGELPVCASNPEGCLPFPSRIIDDIDVLVAQWPTESNPGLIASRYYAQRYLYHKLDGDADYRNSDQTLLAFYNSHRDSEIGRFDSVDHQLQKLHYTSGTDSSILHQIQILIDTTFNQIEFFDFTFGELTELTSASDLHDRSILFHQLDSLYFISQTMRSQIYQQAVSKAQDLFTVVQSLNTSHIFTELEKSVHFISLEMVIEGRLTPDSTEIASLKTIAELCPFTHGVGVQAARAFLAPFVEIQFNDDSPCLNEPQQLISGTTNHANEKLNVAIYPNPASETLQLKIPDYQLGTIIKIISSEGKTVMEKKLILGTDQIQVSHLSRGIYFINVKQGNKSLYLKFIKQ
ncbi:MAG: T9SS type A sorting domain-containing protein [Saprospiraceae bacterium]|nr:T9SS type A sorting domain-containing protein [Saprospiraceae bacterium]